jgi:hypothetical protein
MTNLIEFKEKLDKINNLKFSEIKYLLDDFSEKLNITEIINIQFEKMLKEKYFFPINSSYNRIILIDDIKFELSIIFNTSKTRSEDEVLYSYSNHTFICPILANESSNYVIYEQSHTTDFQVLKENFNLSVKEKGTLKQYKTIFIEKFKNVLEIDKSYSFAAICLAMKKDNYDYSWEYNLKSLKPIRLALTNNAFGRINTSLRIISDIGNKNSIPMLQEFSKHKSHFIRWEAIRTLINIDFELAIKIIKKMSKDDPHIEVRNAAENSINLIKDIK